MLDTLAAYGVDPRTGFVAATDPLDRLTAPYVAWEECAAALPALLRPRRVRTALKELPLLDALELRSTAEQEPEMLILTVFANAWVWGGERVRPYLRGWPDPGVLYEGVSTQRRKYVGGSAGQSSLIQVLDALLGIDHAGTPAGAYLRDVRSYMPIAHRRFILDYSAHSGARRLRDAGACDRRARGRSRSTVRFGVRRRSPQMLHGRQHGVIDCTSSVVWHAHAQHVDTIRQ